MLMMLAYLPGTKELLTNEACNGNSAQGTAGTPAKVCYMLTTNIGSEKSKVALKTTLDSGELRKCIKRQTALLKYHP